MLLFCHTRNLGGSHRREDYFEAARLLQLQYTKTPHYASSILYNYGKTIVNAGRVELLANAISALEEVQRCSVQLRMKNASFYIAKAFSILSDQQKPFACLHAIQYQEGYKQLSYRVGETTPTEKENFISNVLQTHKMAKLEAQTLTDIIDGVRETKQAEFAVMASRGRSPSLRKVTSPNSKGTASGQLLASPTSSSNASPTSA